MSGIFSKKNKKEKIKRKNKERKRNDVLKTNLEG